MEISPSYMNDKEVKCCGSCRFFEYEDIDGFGICAVRDRSYRCSYGEDCDKYQVKVVCEHNPDAYREYDTFGAKPCSIKEGGEMYDPKYCWACID